MFNGEIYNFRELRQQLVASGVSFRGQSDTEVLLALWQQRGASCLPQLNGMFSFAIWDAVEHELVVVRDRSGIKHVFYAELPDGLIFAMNPRHWSLCFRPYHSPRPTLAAPTHYLWCPGPGTFIR